MLRFSLLLLALALPSAYAASYDLYDLVYTNTYGSHSVVIGDKTFTFEVATLTGTGVFTPPTPLSPGDFTLTPQITGNLYGFTLTGSMSATAFVPPVPQSTVDLALTYTVATAAPLMTDLHASLTGACQVNGFGFCNVVMTETAQDINGASLISPSQLNTTLNNSPTQANFLHNADFVRVTKDLQLAATAFSGNSNAFVTVSIIDQFISQVPEPGFYGVLACGVSALLFGRRRKKTA